MNQSYLPLARTASRGVKLRAMMANQTCTNCGAEFIAGARFCRLCGQPSAGANERSVLEAETRTLHTPATYTAAPTDYLSPQPTSPAYLAPGQMPPPFAPNYNAGSFQTGSLQPKGRKKRTGLVIGLLAILILVPLISLVVLAVIRSQTSNVPVFKKIIVTQPQMPQPPVPPAFPPDDKTAPAPPVPKTTISPALIYPGAQTRMEINSGEGAGMLQLRTDDAYDKVLAWYVATIKPTNVIKTGPGSSSILRTDKMVVIITGEGGETNILIKQGESDE